MPTQQSCAGNLCWPVYQGYKHVGVLQPAPTTSVQKIMESCPYLHLSLS